MATTAEGAKTASCGELKEGKFHKNRVLDDKPLIYETEASCVIANAYERSNPRSCDPANISNVALQRKEAQDCAPRSSRLVQSRAEQPGRDRHSLPVYCLTSAQRRCVLTEHLSPR